MKTIREWLEDLPEPYRGQALANMDIQRPGDPGGERPCMRNAIETSFRWRDSIEGTVYWSHLRDKYKSAPWNDDAIPELSPTNAISALHAIALKEGFPVEEIEGVMRQFDAEKGDVWSYRLIGDDKWYIINL